MQVSAEERKNGIALGYRSVTRALETGTALTVFVSASTPRMITQQIPILCAQKGVPLCQLNTSLTQLQTALGIKRMSSFAVKKSTSPKLNSLADYISQRIHPMKIKWLKVETKSV